jgi:hypothetical protein
MHELSLLLFQEDFQTLDFINLVPSSICAWLNLTSKTTSHFALNTFTMQFLNTLFPLLLSSTLVFSAPIAKRDTATVLGNLSMITRNVVYLSSELASFIATPSIGIATFSQHFSDLDKHIDTTTANTNAVGSFNITDSEAIANSASVFANDALNLLIALMNNVNPSHLPVVMNI